jgi:hypothetical protein
MPLLFRVINYGSDMNLIAPLIQGDLGCSEFHDMFRLQSSETINDWNILKSILGCYFFLGSGYSQKNTIADRKTIATA